MEAVNDWTECVNPEGADHHDVCPPVDRIRLDTRRPVTVFRIAAKLSAAIASSKIFI